MVRFPAIVPVALAAFLSGLPGAALAQVYSCKPDDPRSAGNWIAPEIVISHEEGDSKAIVNDAIIDSFVGQPVEAKIDTDNARRTTYSWRVKTKAGTQTATMIYRVTVQKADLTASFIAVPQGYSNTFQVQGRCKRVKG